MANLNSDLKHLNELYFKLEDELNSVKNIAVKNDNAALTESVLRNRACLAQIEQLNSQAIQLSKQFEQSGSQLDPDRRKEAQNLISSLRERALRLSQTCGIIIQRLEAAKADIEKEFSKMQKGINYLNSIKPVKNNYPKFVDSLG
jgi:hypothetical protein